MKRPWFLVDASLEFFPKIEIQFLKSLKTHTKWAIAHLPGPGLMAQGASTECLFRASPPAGAACLSRSAVVCAFSLAGPEPPLTVI